MKIGWLFEHPTLSGGERSALEMLTRLAPPYEPVALSPAEGPLATALAQRGVPHLPHTINRRKADIETLVDQLNAKATAHGLDLLHANTLSTADLAGLARVRSVGHIREIGRLSAARAARLAANERLLAVSNAVAQNLIAQGVPSAKVQTCYNGIDLSLWDPTRWTDAGRTLRKGLGERRLILSVGQLGMRKGQDLLVKAFEQIASPAELWIVGERWSTKQESIDFEQELRARAAGSSQPVRFLGYREDIPALLAAADLVVHPARQEPLGRVIMEAMAMDRPIVATAVGGTPEMLPADVLIPPDDVPALVCALADPPQRGFRARCRERFCSERALNCLLTVYAELAKV